LILGKVESFLAKKSKERRLDHGLISLKFEGFFAK